MKTCNAINGLYPGERVKFVDVGRPGAPLMFHTDLQCYVRKIEYDPRVRIGRVIMSDQSCTDIRGCIRLFQLIDPDVKQVQTFQDQRPDTIYTRVAGPDEPGLKYYGIKGTWKAGFLPRKA